MQWYNMLDMLMESHWAALWLKAYTIGNLTFLSWIRVLYIILYDWALRRIRVFVVLVSIFISDHETNVMTEHVLWPLELPLCLKPLHCSFTFKLFTKKFKSISSRFFFFQCWYVLLGCLCGCWCETETHWNMQLIKNSNNLFVIVTPCLYLFNWNASPPKNKISH